jgi:Phosphatidylglycerophosphate synthase
MGKKLDKEYEASLKSIETENRIDQWFYRPIGFRIAKKLCSTAITPNMVTIFSIFVGAAAGPLFYYDNIYLIITGIACLIFANILDCVDGQLARLTGIKSKTGRILDGIAGDIWFIMIYVFLALRLNHEYGTWMFFIPATISGISHLIQANITDYYKTVHLFFISEEKGSEFQRLSEIREQYKQMKPGIGKVMIFLYTGYTRFQELVTPKLQKFIVKLQDTYDNGHIPDFMRHEFCRQSRHLMKTNIDYMTFNGRTVVLFLAVLTGYVWIYFIYEIVILNIVLLISIYKHEKICFGFTGK